MTHSESLQVTNWMAISVNRSDWHFESNRSVRKIILFIEMIMDLDDQGINRSN